MRSPAPGPYGHLWQWLHPKHALKGLSPSPREVGVGTDSCRAAVLCSCSRGYFRYKIFADTATPALGPKPGVQDRSPSKTQWQRLPVSHPAQGQSYPCGSEQATSAWMPSLTAPRMSAEENGAGGGEGKGGAGPNAQPGQVRLCGSPAVSPQQVVESWGRWPRTRLVDLIVQPWRQKTKPPCQVPCGQIQPVE